MTLIVLSPAAGAMQAGQRLAPAGDEDQVKSGTGFFISPDGYLVTSAHVITQCQGVSVWAEDGRQRGARIAALDPAADIALLQTDDKPPGYLAPRYRQTLRVGERVVTLGLGISTTQPKTPVLTTGNFLSRGEMASGHQVILIRAWLHAGNSGGPVIDDHGSLLGMVIGRDSTRPGIGVVLAAEDIDAFRIRYRAHWSSDDGNLRSEDSAALLRRASALVQCIPGTAAPAPGTRH